MKLFDHLDALTVHKKSFDIHNDEQTKSYNQKIISRFISMSELHIHIVNRLNKYNVPNDVHYRYFLSKLPKRKCYFKYIKGKKEIDDKTRELLCEYYKCANGELEYHLQILTDKQIKTITDLYKHRR